MLISTYPRPVSRSHRPVGNAVVVCPGLRACRFEEFFPPPVTSCRTRWSWPRQFNRPVPSNRYPTTSAESGIQRSVCDRICFPKVGQNVRRQFHPLSCSPDVVSATTASAHCAPPSGSRSRRRNREQPSGWRKGRTTQPVPETVHHRLSEMKTAQIRPGNQRREHRQSSDIAR